MGRWLRRIGIGLAAVLLLLLALLVGALLLVDSDTVKRVVAEQVERNTGRELTIEGELGLSIFPWIGFELGATRLANAAGFGQRPFVALDRAELRVRLLPLLQRQVAVDHVVLHGLEVNLARDAAGRSNWADLVPAQKGESAPVAEPPADTATVDDPGDTRVQLRVEGLEILDANLHWRDATAGRSVSVRDLNLETGPLEPGVATPLSLSVRLQPDGAPIVAIVLRTEATLEPEIRRLTLSGLTADLQASGADLPGGEIGVRAGADVVADFAAERVRIDPLEVAVAATVTAHGAVVADTAQPQPVVSGRLGVRSFSPRALMQVLELTLPDAISPQVLQTASAELGFVAAGQELRVDDLVLTLDDSRATGSLRARGGDVPAAELELAVDALDLDRYLPARAEPAANAEIATATGAPAEDPVARLPLESMRGFRANASIDVGRLGIRGLDARNVRLRARLDAGLLTLERLALELAGGSLNLAGRIDGRSDAPSAGLDLRVDAIQAAPLLRALTGSVPVSGRLEAALELDTAGATLDQWLGALNGALSTTFSDGAIEGINIAQRIRVGWARLKGAEVNAAAAQRRTDFSRLHFAGSIRDGVLHSDELDLRAPLLRAGGSGQLDLRRQQIDYRARVVVTGTLKGQGGRSLDEVRGLEIPVRVHGTLTDPKIELALADALEARAKARQQELRREASEAEEEARRELEVERQKAQRKLQQEQAEARQKMEQQKQELERRKDAEESKAREKLQEKLKGLFD